VHLNRAVCIVLAQLSDPRNDVIFHFISLKLNILVAKINIKILRLPINLDEIAK
jgi:hypothetical protein